MVRWHKRVEKLKEWDPRVLGFIAVVVLDLTVAAFLVRLILTYSDYPFDSDEALHAMRGLRLAFDLRQGDLGAFLQDLLQQSIYPPGSVWLETLVFAAFRPTIVSARLCSLACLVGVIPIIYAIGLELDEARGWLIGLVAVGFTLSSRPVLIQAALVMTEMPGLLVSFATLLSYVRTMDRDVPRVLVVTSLLMALTLLTKYPYGFFVLPTVGLAELLTWLSRSPRQQVERKARRWGWLFIPCAVIMSVWFAGEGKIEDFVYYATLQPKDVDWYNLRNLLFYPRSIALHYAPSPLLAPVMFGGLIWSLSQWRHSQLRLMLLYASVGLLVVTVKESNNPRFMLTIAPAIHLITGVVVARSIVWVRERVLNTTHLIVIGLSVSLFTLAFLFPAVITRLAVFPNLLEVAYETDPRSRELADWIIDQTQGQRFYLVNGWDQFSANAMAWHVATRAPHGHLDVARLSVPSTRLQTFNAASVDNFRSQVCSHRTPYVVVLDLGVSSQTVWPDYATALSDFMRPVAAEGFPLDLYYVNDWLKNNLVTREGLAKAKSQFHFSLQVQAMVYQVLDQRCVGNAPVESPSQMKPMPSRDLLRSEGPGRSLGIVLDVFLAKKKDLEWADLPMLKYFSLL